MRRQLKKENSIGAPFFCHLDLCASKRSSYFSLLLYSRLEPQFFHRSFAACRPPARSLACSLERSTDSRARRLAASRRSPRNTRVASLIACGRVGDEISSPLRYDGRRVFAPIGSLQSLASVANRCELSKCAGGFWFFVVVSKRAAFC